jgi:hypothetical protein
MTSSAVAVHERRKAKRTVTEVADYCRSQALKIADRGGEGLRPSG